MAVGSTPPIVGAGAAAATPSPANRRFIDRQLAKTRRHVRLVDFFSGLMLLAAAVLAALLAAAVIDAWVFDLGRTGRIVALVLIVSGSGWYFLARLAPLLLRPINPAYAAQAIEQVSPSLKNGLINLLMLRRDGHDVREVVYEALEAQTAAQLVHAPVDAAVDRSKLIVIGYLLAGVMTVSAIYKVLSPKDPFASFARVLAPLADIDRPTSVRIEEIEPGDAQIVAGQPLAFAARVRGVDEQDAVSLCIARTSDDLQAAAAAIRRGDAQPASEAPKSFGAFGELFPRRLAVRMEHRQGDLKRRCELPPLADGVDRLHYCIVAGDTQSQEFTLELLPLTIAVERIEYDFPDYTGRKTLVVDRKSDQPSPRPADVDYVLLETPGDLKAIEGTRITLYARADQPIGEAYIEFDPHREGERETYASRLPMTADQDRAQAAFLLAMKPDRSAGEHGSYQLRFKSKGGFLNARPIESTIEVIPDVAPSVELLRPRAESTQLPANSELAIEVRAVDPDYQLADLRLEFERNGSPLPEAPLLGDGSSTQGQVTATFEFVPARHDCQAGDVVRIRAKAMDNRTPEANVAWSVWREVVVTAPLARPDADASSSAASKTDDPDKDKSPGQASNTQPRQGAGGAAAQNAKTPDKAAAPPQGSPAERTPEGAGEKPSEGAREEKNPMPSPTPEGGQGESAAGQQSSTSQGGSSQQQDSGAGQQQGGGAGDDQQQGAGAGQQQGGGAGGQQTGEPSQDQQGTGGGPGGNRSAGSSSADASPSNPGAPSGSQSGAPTGQNGQPSGSSPQQGADSATGGGQSAAPAEHDGEAFERILQHRQKSGGQGDASSQASKAQGAGGQDAAQSQQSGGEPSASGASPMGGQENAKSSNGAQGEDSGPPGSPPQGQQGAGQSGDSSEGAQNQAGGGDAGPAQGESAEGSSPADGQGGGSEQGGADQGGQNQGENPGGADQSQQKNGSASSAGGEQQPAGGDSASSSQGDQSSPHGKQPGAQAGHSAQTGGGQQQAGASSQGASSQGDSGAASQPQASNSGQGKETGGGAEAQGESQAPAQGAQDGGERQESASGRQGESGAGNSGQSQSGSPMPQGKNRDRDKQSRASENASENQQSASSSTSDRQSDSQGDEQGDRSGGGGAGGGQGARLPGNDQQGESTPADEGAGQSDSPGNADAGERAGQDQSSSRPTGKSGNERGAGSSSRASASGEPGASGRNAGDSGRGGPNQPGGGSSGDYGEGADGAPGEAPPADEANLEYARKATDLALEYLKDQKDSTDKSLLRDLGWSQEQLDDFLKRWQAMRDDARTSDQARKEWEASLESLGLAPAADRRRAAQVKKDDLRKMREGAVRTDPPPAHLEGFKAFSQALNRDE